MLCDVCYYLMRDVRMDKRKIDFLKRFSIVLFLYFWFICIVWFVPEWDLIGKISWTFFLLMLLHFTHATLDLVDRIEIWLEGNRGYVIERSKVDLTVIYEMKKAIRVMGNRIRLELMKSLSKNESDETPGNLRRALFRTGQFSNDSIKLREKLKDESNL